VEDLGVKLQSLDGARVAASQGFDKASPAMRVAATSEAAGVLDAVVGGRAVAHHAAERAPLERYSTVIVRAPKAFQQGTLWPAFLALAQELHTHLEDLTERVIREAINEDVSEAVEQPTKALPQPSGA
jgi:hypothetical protein